ncbi:ATP-dependent helicase HrpB [Colwellia sp. UCD-KL20]|uniref:ATP-dependent helicase HrpB n=1 Tax=Colwellia sp. UCD-KL20 TaxID=1917165 RepID=UPI0009704A86|nr:ATP-dependent helicase HrpB [Colwellia sp. UCD-KL20]
MTQHFPIDAIKDEFLAALEKHNTLILTAPPGAGKSTRLPLWLLSLAQYKDKKIYLLQPRRVAAKNIACYLSQQIGEAVGQTIGYRLKNESKVSNNTRLEVITEGILTQIIQNDAELSGCGLVILDEFHERSLHGDLAYALARDVQQALREDLQLVIMSATLAVKSLTEKLPDAITLASEGRSFPVDIKYVPNVTSKRLQQHYSVANQWREHALNVIAQQAVEHDGSILVFLPGVADIKYLCQNLSDKLVNAFIQLCPLYGELSIAEQQKAIAPSANGERKLVLATNIAETSLTIEGVTLVIDCGFEKTAIYDPKTLTNKLQQQVISKASAIQRAGRAGRLSAGKCLRLYSQEDFGRRDENSKSEIQQADLLPFVIEAARWGVTQLCDLPLIELPNEVKEQQAWQELQSLNIVTQQNQLTSHGKQVAGVACHPRFAHMIIMAKSLEQKHNVKGLLSLACLIAVLLEERDVFSRDQSRFDCNLIHRIDALLNGEVRGHLAHQIFKQADQLAKKFNTSVKSHSQLPVHYSGVLLALAYPERIAKYRYEESSSSKTTKKSSQQTGEYLTTAGKGITINHEDALLGEATIVAAQVSEVNLRAGQASKGQKGLMVQLAAPVDIEKLIDWDIVQTRTEIDTAYNAKVDRITAQKLTKINALVIDERAAPEQLNNDLVARLWAKELTKQGLAFLPLKDKDQALLLRWRWLILHNKRIDLPSCDEENLLATIDTWFLPFVGDIKSKKQLDKCNFTEMFLSLLTYQQQQTLEKAAPEYFIGPTKRRCAIRYTEDKMPIVSMPMQELYGLTETPCIGNDKADKSGIPLILEILSPAKRPIQVTQDLAAFWQGSYKAVQKDMKSQYPRHFWPDDPANAKATRKTKRHMMNDADLS